jgi:hypothetical protein
MTFIVLSRPNFDHMCLLVRFFSLLASILICNHSTDKY